MNMEMLENFTGGPTWVFEYARKIWSIEPSRSAHQNLSW
jgi:hypothetical protein